MENTEASARYFADYLREIERGRLHADLSTELRALTQSVVEVGKKGTLTLTLDVTPQNGVNSETVVIAPSIKVTHPKPARKSALYFVQDDHNLSRTDPNQMDIENHLSSVDGGKS